VTFAIAVAPCVRGKGADVAIALSFPGATVLTQYWLSSGASVDNGVMFNGKELVVGVGLPLPSLAGELVQGDTVVIPAAGACTVGFVHAVYEHPIEACTH
jgi:hypothetical protein